MQHIQESEVWQAAPDQPAWSGSSLPIDPQPSFREYSSVNQQSNPGATPPAAWPSYPSANQTASPWPAQSQPGTPFNYNNAPVPYPGYPAQQPAFPNPSTPYAGYPGQQSAFPNPGTPMPYPGYPPQPMYPGYALPYPPYAYNNFYPVQVAPARDTYTFVVGIIGFICSCLAILGGLVCAGLLGLVNLTLNLGTSTFDPSRQFASQMLFVALGLAGIVGGSFCAYHSARSIFMRKPSHTIWLPRFWLFLLSYVAILGIGYLLHTIGADTSNPTLLGLLICLCAALPAFTVLSLGVRRLRASRTSPWPTTWRRMIFALVSGATLAIVLAAILEFVFEIILLGSQGRGLLSSLVNSNIDLSNPTLAALLLVILAVIAPIVEELIKPLAVIVLIGRVQSKAEAFVLGLACGIGFNLIETTGYISQGFDTWLNVALLRSGAGLLHGFGAGMMALGWYILTHKEEGARARRILLALGCGIYAILQHALWNGSWGLGLLPGPIGSFVQNWSITIGPVFIDAPILFELIEMLAILVFFLFVTGRLRSKNPPRSTEATNSQAQLALKQS